jgi:hypothetical protein
MRVGVIARLLPAAALLIGCGARSLVPDAGGTGGGGAGGSGGPICELCLDGKLSDFEDIAGATIVHDGTPPRNGYWYAYNDGSDTCRQRPSPSPGGDPPGSYVGEAPATPSPGPSGSLALHAQWTGCTISGAGVGADINVPLSPDGGIYYGPKVPYDLSRYLGLTFWAMAMPNSDVHLRVMLPMRAETLIAEGGLCDEGIADPGKCGDSYGEDFSLPANNNWKQVTVRFADAGFLQQGWGAVVPWDPRDVTGIQIHSVDVAESYDFWIDDVYLLQ